MHAFNGSHITDTLLNVLQPINYLVYDIIAFKCDLVYPLTR